MKKLKSFSLIVLVLFLSSCKQSFLASKYNHLDKVEKVTTTATQKKAISSRPYIKADSTKISNKIAAQTTNQDTINELTATTEKSIYFSFQPKLKAVDKTYTLTQPKTGKNQYPIAEKTNHKKKAYLFLSGGLLMLFIGFLMLLVNSLAAIFIFPIALTLIILGIIHYRKSDKADILKAVLVLTLIATFFITCFSVFYLLFNDFSLGLSSNSTI